MYNQAQSNLKYLSVMKDLSFELSTAKPDRVNEVLPRMLNLIRIIWMNSEHYNSRTAITGLILRVRSLTSAGIL